MNIFIRMDGGGRYSGVVTGAAVTLSPDRDRRRHTWYATSERSVSKSSQTGSHAFWRVTGYRHQARPGFRTGP